MAEAGNLHEYVLSDELAVIIEESGIKYAVLAEKAGVNPRAIYRIRKRETYATDFFLADKILTALGKHTENQLTTRTRTIIGKVPLAEDDPRHGTHNAYQWHRCRCKSCTLANSKACKAYRERRRERETK